MRPTFFGIEIAKTGLFISQKSLDVTGHNIANVDTLGYTRQRVIQSNLEPYGAYLQYRPMEQGRVGQGVRGDYVDQIRDIYLDIHYRSEMPVYTDWETRADVTDKVDDIFVNALDTSPDKPAGLARHMTDFFNAWSTLSNASGTFESSRTVVREKGDTVISAFKLYYDNMVKLQKMQDDQISGNVDKINNIAEQIALLDKKIYLFEYVTVTGPNLEQANDLRDHRNLLMDELSTLTNYDYTYEQNTGKLSITIGGKKLVDHDRFTTMTCAGAKKTNDIPGEADMFNVYWSDDPATAINADFKSGDMAARFAMRDGNTTDVQGVPYFVAELTKLAKGIADAVNTVHAGGYTYPNGTNPSVTGVNFFEPFTTIKDMSLSAEVKASIYNIAAADKIINSDLINAGDIDNAKEIFALLSNENIAVVGNFQSFLEGFISNIGTQGQRTAQMAATEANVMANIDTQRKSISAVSIDEEVTNLVKYGHSYAANGRVLTALDEALDKLINQTGIVGR